MDEERICRSALKEQAKASMRETRPRPAGVSFVFMLLTTGMSLGVSLVSVLTQGFHYEDLFRAAAEDSPEMMLELLANMGGQTFVIWLLTLMVDLFILLVTFGYQTWSLRVSRGEKTGYRDLIAGFGYAGRVLGTNLMIYLISMAAAMVAMLAMLGCTFLASMAAVACNLSDELTLGIVLTTVLVTGIGGTIAAEVFLVRYAMAVPALANDPELRTSGALALSQRLMRGRTWEYIKLHLSFLGWYLLELVIGLVAAFAAMAVLAFALLGPILAEDPNGMEWTAEMIRNLMLGTGVVWAVTFLACLPLGLWLVAYRSVTVANYFYVLMEQDARRYPAAWQRGMGQTGRTPPMDGQFWGGQPPQDGGFWQQPEVPPAGTGGSGPWEPPAPQPQPESEAGEGQEESLAPSAAPSEDDGSAHEESREDEPGESPEPRPTDPVPPTQPRPWRDDRSGPF